MKIKTDMHTHTEYSHDSIFQTEQMVHAQIEQGIEIIAITEHCDLHIITDIDVCENIIKSHIKADEISKKYNNAKILKGIEIGEGIWYPKYAKKITETMHFDVVLGSVHAVRSLKSCIPYSQIDFSTWSDKEIDVYIRCYFNDILEMVDTLDFDVLTHLICPLRYINKDVDLTLYSDKINEILNKIIDKNISLEINTSDKRLLDKFTTILERYLHLGGRIITVGSDAHTYEGIIKNYEAVQKLLHEFKINEIYYFQNRKPIKIRIEE